MITHGLQEEKILIFPMLPQLRLKWKFLKPFRQDTDDTIKGRMIVLGKQFAHSMRKNPIYLPLYKLDGYTGTCITFHKCIVKTMILKHLR